MSLATARPVRPQGTRKTIIRHTDGFVTVHSQRTNAKGVTRKATVTYKVG